MPYKPRKNMHDSRNAPPPAAVGRIAVISCAVLEREVLHFAKGVDHIAHIEMMEQGLHNDPPLLRTRLQTAIDRVEAACEPDAIVLVYGLCSRGTEGVRTQHAKLVIARAHDCITHLLGSKEAYAAYVKAHPGTYWYSPGWIEHHTPPGRERYEKLLREYTEKYGKDNAEYLMETEQHWFHTYDRATYVDLTIGDTDRDRQYTQECADWLGWQYDHQRGDPQLLIDLLHGRWDDERFVVLEAGQSFQLCADARVIEPLPPPVVQATLKTQDEDETIELLVGAGTLADQLAEHDHPLNTRCGQKGICEGCSVSLLKGKLRALDNGSVVEAIDAPVEVKACLHRIEPDEAIVLSIPSRSTLGHQPQVVSRFKINIPYAHDPIPIATDRTTSVAIDIGTTTIVVMLIELATGRILAKRSGFNKQIREGDNVLTRINLCSTDPKALKRLQNAVIEDTIAPLLTGVLDQAEQARENIGAVVIAANTTMLHLFAGIDPTPMGVAPFTPVFTQHRILGSEILPDIVPDKTPVHLLPSAAAYLGADVVCGMIATGMVYEDGPVLLIDIGTNGEIVLGHRGKIIGCATAAGPAFEGAGLSSGCRAGEGAISHVTFDSSTHLVSLDVIDNTKPKGICGSAYIDLIAEGRRIGLLNECGRFSPEAAQHLGIELRKTTDDGFAWQLTDNVSISESDIASLLQAKAAIGSGIITLLENYGLTPADLRGCYLAGGFGLYLNVYNTIAVGLLPEFDPATVRVVGNTSLAGAYLATVDRHLMDEMAHWAANMEVIELNSDPSYELRYIEHLLIP